jgi:hypothetical protein
MERLRGSLRGRVFGGCCSPSTRSPGCRGNATSERNYSFFGRVFVRTMAPICRWTRYCDKLMQNCTARSIWRNHAHEKASKKREWRRPLMACFLSLSLSSSLSLSPLYLSSSLSLFLSFSLSLLSIYLPLSLSFFLSLSPLYLSSSLSLFLSLSLSSLSIFLSLIIPSRTKGFLRISNYCYAVEIMQ